MEETEEDIASAFEVGLTIGVNTPDEVIAWADSVVGNSEYPPVWMIPIALTQETDRLALLKLLRVSPKPESETMRWCLVCESILSALDRGECSLRLVSSALTHCTLPDSEEKPLAQIEARYQSSDAGEADWETVNGEFLRYLQRVITDARMPEE
ncbi:MAG: hypothetical protein KDB61_01090 [Planctomycetes bacterium]|nr:hypothetical protein [Planctomycetota bacterium]